MEEFSKVVHTVKSQVFLHLQNISDLVYWDRADSQKYSSHFQRIPHANLMNVLDGFLEMPSDFKIYDAFLVDKFSRACAYHRIVCVITSSENWSTKT